MIAPGTQLATAMNVDISGVRRSELAHILSTDEAGYDRYEGLVQKYGSDLAKHQRAYEELILQEDQRRMLEKFNEEWKKYMAVDQEVLRLSRAGQRQEAARLVQGATREQFGKAENALRELVILQVQQAKAAADAGDAVYLSARLFTISALAVCLVVVCFLSICCGRLIARPLRQAASQIKQAQQQQDLTIHLAAASNDEVGDIAQTFNGFVHAVHETVASFSAATNQLADAAEEMSRSAETAANGAEEQGQKTRDISTSTSRMSLAIAEISATSLQAAETTRTAAASARAGGKLITETVSNMRHVAQSVAATAQTLEKLDKSSSEIGKFVGVIEDIADQTNLLALNAAIEAARAGEQGRGFAVVADEVRKLADHTTTATREIAKMVAAVQEETAKAVRTIRASSEQVDSGVAITSNAVETMISSAAQVGDLVARIAAIAKEQSGTTDEINSNMERIANSTAESAAGAQKSATASHHLSELALSLQQLVHRFKLEDRPSPGEASPPVRRPSPLRLPGDGYSPILRK